MARARERPCHSGTRESSVKRIRDLNWHVFDEFRQFPFNAPQQKRIAELKQVGNRLRDHGRYDVPLEEQKQAPNYGRRLDLRRGTATLPLVALTLKMWNDG